MGRDEIRAPLKTPAWEASRTADGTLPRRPPSPTSANQSIIQLTPDTSNQSRFPMDFLYTFTVILPFDNSNLPLTRGDICFPSDDFYIILPCSKVRNIEFISKQPRQFFCLYFFVTPVEIQCSSLHINQALHSLLIHLLISGYLLRNPDNSNFFSISLEGSSYRESTVHISGFSCGSVRSRFICVKKRNCRR